MDLTINEEDIKAALISQSGNIYSKADVTQFLQHHDYYKHVGARFLCWLIQLELLSPIRAKWVTELYNLHNSYNKIRLERFPEQSHQYNSQFNPMSLLSDKIQNSINADLSVSQAWFEKLIEQVGIQPHYKEDAKTRFSRIITAINLENPSLSYTQGNDRLIWASYLVALSFSSNGGLDRSFAESMAYFLSIALISRIKISRYITDLSRLERHFSKLDWLLEREEPEISDVLIQEQHSAIHYAMKWELTLFADEHNAHELMFIWDQIFSRLDEYNEFLRCLCVSHIKQVPLAKNPGEMAMNIQKNRVWDVSKIVDDAVDMMVTKEVSCFSKFWKSVVTMFQEHCVF
ncbi:hypothetical protein TRFO_23823 [Tritrichomonas foetus]|uniref:Rab-GAP TBC domain-containing protein n=1 Tax=Tritrichomonas foetus TaxID=1144522 RepID=A0A1J4KEB2_9EUKA|nr:hypothetical protein TRFO_23823 [Tritrichomonas foetus]|eukprot:OHT07797.1 hypothetical protein TRFO_23823 [Tritrichomonas foetus]